MNTSLLSSLIPLYDAAGSPTGGVRVNTMRPKLLGEVLTPPLKIPVSWIQSTPVRSPQLHNQMHMRMSLIIACCKDVCASIAKLECRKITRRIADGLPVRSRRHRKDIEYFAARAGVRYPPSAELPGFREVAQRIDTQRGADNPHSRLQKPVVARQSERHQHPHGVARIAGRAGSLRIHWTIQLTGHFTGLSSETWSHVVRVTAAWPNTLRQRYCLPRLQALDCAPLLWRRSQAHSRSRRQQIVLSPFLPASADAPTR